MQSSILGQGINLETEQEEDVTIGDIERRGGLYVLGRARTGKSTLLINLILQDIAHGHGLCFLDPHGDAIQEILKRMPAHRKDDVIYLDPFDETHAFGLNLFQCDPRDKMQISRTVDFVLQIFAKLFTESGNLRKEAITMYETLLNTAILLIYNQGYTLAEVPLLLEEEDAATKLIPNIAPTHDDVARWWIRHHRKNQQDKDATTKSTLTRLQAFLTDEHIKHIVGQGRSTLNFQQITDERKILLVKLSQQSEEVTKLVGSMIIGLLLTAAYGRDTRDDTEKTRPHFCIYADEFQHFATPDFAKLFEETGKFHYAPTVAHQERASQFEQHDKNRGATKGAASIVVFRTIVDDAQEFAPEFAKKPPAAETRKEQKLDFTAEAVNWFRQGNRKNTRVTELVEKYLQPFFEDDKKSERLLGRKWSQNIEYYDVVDNFLVNAMRGQVLQSSKEQQQLLEKLLAHMRIRDKYIQELSLPMSKTELLAYEDIIFQFAHTLDLFLLCRGDGQFPPDAPLKLYDVLYLQIYQSTHDCFQSDGGWKIFKIQPHPEMRKLIYDCYIKTDIDDDDEEDEEDIVLQNIPGYQKAVNKLIDTFYKSQQGKEYLDASRAYDQKLERWQQAVNRINLIRPSSYYEQLKTRWVEPDNPKPEPSEYLQHFQRELDAQLDELKASFLLPISRAEKKRLKQNAQKNAQRKQEKFAKQLATEWATKFRDRFITFVAEWDELAGLLATDPIKLPTGEYVEKPGAQRTFADMVNEMAMELPNLPRYTAYCKIVKEVAGKQHILKYKLAPDPLSVVDATQLHVAAAQTQEIRERTHRLSCKERVKVEEEITARRTELLKPVKKERKAKTGDEGDVLAKRLAHLSDTQKRKLESIRIALGKDYDRFITDLSVLHHDNLERLLEKGVDAQFIKKALDIWRDAGAPSGVSPFAELIKTLLG